MTINVNVLIKTFSDVSGAKAVDNNLQKIAKSTTQIGSISDVVKKTWMKNEDISLNWNKTIAGSLNTTRGLSKNVSFLTNGFKGLKEETAKFQMEYLSIMFFGMAIQRFFGGLFRSMKNVYDEATGKQSKLTQSTTRLAAAWSFFQFSVMKALEPLLIPVIEFVIELVDGLNKLPKPIKQAIGLLIILAAALGLVMFAAGTTKLGLGGIGTVLASVGKNMDVLILKSPALASALGITPGMGLSGAAGAVFSALVLVAGVVALLVGVFAGLSTAIDVLDPVFEKFGINTEGIKELLGDVIGTVWKFAQSLVVWIGVGVKNAGILLFGFFGLVLEKAFTFGTILGSIIMLLGQSISTGLEIAFFAGIGIINAFIISAEVAVNAFIGLVNGVIAAYNVAAAYLGLGTLDSVVTVSLESLMVEQDIDAINRSAAKTQKAMEAVGKTVEDFTSADGIVKIFEAVKDVSQEGNKDLDAIWNTTKQISKDAVDSAKDMEDSFDKTLDDATQTQAALAETKAAQITSVGIETVDYNPTFNISGATEEQADELKRISSEFFDEFVGEITDKVKAEVS